MRRIGTAVICALTATLAAVACSGRTDDGNNQATVTIEDVGTACIPENETRADFAGFGATEVNLETGSPSCETGVCLAYLYQGRVSCPHGVSCQTTADPPEPVTVSVEPELADRSAADRVYCSCRCDGAEGSGPFCACPGGFECRPIVPEYGVGGGPENLSGSYCIKAGTFGG